MIAMNTIFFFGKVLVLQSRLSKLTHCFIFVFGLLCRHTAINSITSELYTLKWFFPADFFFLKWHQQLFFHQKQLFWPPPRNGKIELLLTTNGLMCSKHVSQKHNETIDNHAKCYSILYCNSPWLYFRLKYTYLVISVKLDSLPGISTELRIDLFVAFGVLLVHSWARKSCDVAQRKRMILVLKFEWDHDLEIGSSLVYIN